MDAVEDIKQRLSIEDVVGEYVALKRAGRNFKGLSPFTSEKTPSFVVSPEKQIWHDFSSGKGGSMFSFVMEMEGLDFRGSLEHLARKAGIDLAQYQTGQSADTSKLKARLYEALEAAARFYQVQFTRNKTALKYVLEDRKFTKEIALAFKIGYSPNNGSALSEFLKAKGFSDKELSQAGLTAKRYKGVGDMFRGRLMVPLMDPGGRVIGFTARLLVDEPGAPKYINTPQTPLYDKSRHVFGLHLAKEALRKSKYAVLVEGNLDVIASHQVGISQVVATAGTALTEMQLKALSRFTNDIRLAFDQDKAGQAAAERAIPIASKVGINLSMVNIPSGKDPDELIKQDVSLWQEALDKPAYALDWLIERYKGQLDLSTASGKRQFSDVVIKVIRQLPDQVEQDHYMGKIADIIGASKEALNSKLRAEAQQTVRMKRAVNVKKLDPKTLDLTKTQNQLLCLALMRVSFRKYLDDISAEMLPEERARKLFNFLKANPDFTGGKPPAPSKKDQALQAGIAHGASEVTKLLHLNAAQGDDEAPSNSHQRGQADGVQGASEERTEPYLLYGEGVPDGSTPQSAVSRNGVTSSDGQQVPALSSLEDYVKMLGLQYEATYQDLDQVELHYEAARLQVRLIEQFVKTKKHELVLAMQNANDAQIHQLLAQARNLDALLNKTKENRLNDR